MESVGLCLVETSSSVREIFSLNKSAERTSGVTVIPLEIILFNISSTSLFNIIHRSPRDLQSRSISSLSNNRLFHLCRFFEDTHEISTSVVVRPFRSPNAVSSLNSGIYNGINWDKIRLAHKSLHWDQARGGLRILAFTRKVNVTPNRSEEFLLILFLGGRFSNLEVDGTNVASSIVGHNPANSYRASFNLKVKRLHLFGLNSHIDLEFLREITRSTVSRNGSKFEPVNVSSLKVIQLERSSLSSSNLSGASESVRVSNTVRSLLNFLSIPKLKRGVR